MLGLRLASFLFFAMLRQKFVSISHISMRAMCPNQLVFLNLVIQLVWEEYKFSSSSLCNFLKIPLS